MPLDPDTITHYEQVTREFLDTVKRSLPSEVTKHYLKDWMVEQRERVSHRTVCNLYVSFACLLHFCGVDHKKLLPQSERPTEFLLKTGAREREKTHLEWSDLNLGPNPIRWALG